MKELESLPRIREQVCKPNSVRPTSKAGAAIIPLGRPSPNGSSDLPGGVARGLSSVRLRTGSPMSRLPIWSCTARSLPGRACCQTRRCALTFGTSLAYDRSPRTISPITTLRVDACAPAGLFNAAGLFSVALVVARRSKLPLSRSSKRRAPSR